MRRRIRLAKPKRSNVGQCIRRLGSKALSFNRSQRSEWMRLVKFRKGCSVFCGEGGGGVVEDGELTGVDGRIGVIFFFFPFPELTGVFLLAIIGEKFGL